MNQGTVKFFNETKGFGFIKEIDSDAEHFVHISGVIDRIKEGDKVLEIGSGSGYQTSILVTMKAEVYSIERIYELYKKSKRILSIEKFLTLLICLFLRRFIKSFLLKNNLLTKSSKSSIKLSVYFCESNS